MTNPVEEAVRPLKSQAIERAERDARAMIERVLADLAASGWDGGKVAPYPRSTGVGRVAYATAMRKYRLYRAVTEAGWVTRRFSDPDTLKKSEKREAKFVQDQVDLAASQYDAFVAKMVDKIGPCDAAILDGSHVWGYSILTVTKGALVERWKTQQIVNVSSRGLTFNQWPSRKIK